MNLFTGISEWQKWKDNLILEKIKHQPEREEELMALSDKADKLIMKSRKHNYDMEMKGGLR